MKNAVPLALRLTSWVQLIAFVVAVATWARPARPADSLSPADVEHGSAVTVPRRHALLIGCTAYPTLGPHLQLTGPANDIALTTSLLKERFGFTDGEIVALLHDRDEEHRPTAANIEREFAAVADRVHAGDIVFVFLAGHGSQLQNDNPNDPNDFERDGLDEVFLPEDVTEWSLAKPAVGAIRDDQIGAWLDAIRAKQAAVFFVADTCHSGTMDRGSSPSAGLVRSRWVDPRLLNPPQPPDPAPEKELALPDPAEPRAGAADTAAGIGRSLGPLIALYAVSDNATETEEPMPPYERADSPVYGRLAYALNDVLTRTRRPLTYLELAQQISWRYEGWNWQDVGMLAGSSAAFHDEVLGRQSWRDRSTVTLRRGEFGELSLDVGHLHGAAIGSKYKVFPPAGADGDDIPAGCVVITELTPTTARVEPCAFDQLPETPFDQLPAPGRCELAFSAAPSLKLSIALATAPFDPVARRADLAAAVAVVEELSAQPNALVSLAGADELPDAWVLVGSRGLYLRRAADAMRSVDDGTAPGVGQEAAFPEDAFGPFLADAAAGSKLDLALDAMGKAVNIRRLAESGALMVIGDPNSPAVELTTTVERWSSQTKGFAAVDGAQPIVVQEGEQLRVVVANDSRHPVDVTVLYIDSAFSVTSYLPTAYQNATGTAHNRLAPGQSESVMFKINAATLGLEDVIIIATLTTPAAPMQNFVFLEQRGVDRGEKGPGSAADTPLGQLLSTAAFASGDRGGNAAPDMARYAIRRVSWRVQAQAARP